MAIIRNVQELRDYFGVNPVLIGDLPVDVLRSETPVFDFNLTEHPVESGFDITDARIERPIGVTLEVILTDTELSASAVGFAALNDTLGFDTWKDKRDRLYEIKNSSEIIDVVTPLDKYESMVITSLRVDQTPQTARALFARIDFREIRVVKSQITGVDDNAVSALTRSKKPDNDADKKIKDKKDLGTKQAKDATEKQKSILLSGLESLGLVG
jgi:hypothetical protein